MDKPRDPVDLAAELTRARAEIRELARSAESTRERCAQFLSGLTHELRAPIGSIQMLAEVLGEAPTGTTNQLEQIRHAASALRDLIDEAGFLNRIDSERVTIFPREVSLAELLRRVEDSYRKRCEERHVVLSTLIEEELPDTVHTDRRLLDRIVGYLVAIAISVSERATVEVHVARDETGDDAIRIAVRDTGPPLPEDSESLFEPFAHRGPRARHRHGGASLRLPIARRLCALLGGELRLANVDDGTVATLILPLATFAAPD